MTVTIKIYFSLPSGKQEIRRFTTDAPAILPALLSFLHTTYSPHYQPPLKFSIAYDDDEDLIAVNSEEELREGLSLHAASGAGGVLKLLCSFDQSAASGLASPSGLASGASTPASLSGLPTFPASPSVSVAAAKAEAGVSAPIVTEPTDTEAEPEATSADQHSEPDEADDGEIVSGNDSDAEYVRLEADEPEPLSAAADPHPLAASEGSQSASQTLVADLFQAPEPEPAADQAGAGSAPPAAEPEVEVEASPVAVAPAVTVEDVTGGDEAADHETEAEEAQAEPESPAPISQQQQQAAAAIVHPHVVCDGCGQNPLVGTRFHCRSCRMPGGFDFCADCHEQRNVNGAHPASHSFVAYATPEQAAAADAEADADAFTSEQQDCLDMLHALSAKITRVMDGAAADEEAQAQSHSQSSSSSQSSASASSSAVPASGALAVHSGITCDGCGQSPLLGNRYHCTVCRVPGGFDLCEPCEESGAKHPASHVMLKMRVPGSAAAFMNIRGGRRHGHGHGHSHGHGHGHCPFRPSAAAAPSTERPKAEFISDVSVGDGLQVHGGETLRKVWSVRNSGPSAWPAGTRLVFVGGDLAAGPAAGSEGRADADADADAHGALVPFAGPGDVVHVAVDIVVPQESGRFRATFRLQTPDQIRFGPRIWIDVTVPEEPQEEPLSERESAVSASVPASSASSPATAHACPESAAVTLPVAVPVSASAVAVPERAAVAESKQAEEEAALSLAASPASAPSVMAAAPPSGAPFAYSNQLAVLRGMGFADRELCKYLLLNNRGDLEKVVTWLLANAK